MSTSIPLEIQEEIIKRVVHVKSLLRFRRVSKQWKCFIDSPELISHHYSLVKQTQSPQLLVGYNSYRGETYVSINDDDSFPNNMFYPTRPSISYDSSVIIGYSHGLVCLSTRLYFRRYERRQIVIWNPYVRKSFGIILPEVRYVTGIGVCVIGFGVCPKTLDPKIVKFTTSTIDSMDMKAEVWTLSTRAWKGASMNNLCVPPKLEEIYEQQVVLDGAIHWVDYVMIKNDYSRRIVSFDLTSEEFGEVLLPKILSRGQLSILKLKESLALIDYNLGHPLCGDVWMRINNGDPKCSFAKLYSVRLDPPDSLPINTIKTISIIGSRKNGQLIRQHKCMDRRGSRAKLEAYEPYTQHSKTLGFFENWNGGFSVTSYTESLLLLNHSNFLVK